MTTKMILLQKEKEKIITKWKSFIDRLSEPACLISDQNQVVFYNHSFNKLYFHSNLNGTTRLEDLFVLSNLNLNAEVHDRASLKGISVRSQKQIEIDCTRLDDTKNTFQLCIVRNAQLKTSIDLSNQFHKKILDNLFQEIVALDTDFNFIYFSAATLKDQHLRNWLIGRSDYDYCKKRGVDTKVADTRFQHYRKALESKEVVDWVEYFPVKNGSEKKMFRKISPILNNYGDVEFLLVNSFFDSDELILKHEYEVSKKRFDAMVQNSPDPIVLFDASNQFCVDVNKAAIELIGSSKVDFLDSTFTDLSFKIQPNVSDNQAFISEKLKATINGEKVSFNWLIKSSDGTIIPTQVRFVQLPSSKRTLIRASFRDISEQLAAEQNQRQYQMLFENSQQGILVYNISKNKIVSCNSKACEIYGFSEEELLSLPYGHHSPIKQENGADSGELIKKYTHTIFEKGNAKMEIEQYHNNGKLITLDVTGYKLRDQGEELMVSVFTDISEQIQVRQKLQNQSDQFKQFVENNPSAVAMLDTNMNYLLVSKEWEANYSINGDSLIGQNHYELHPEIPERWKKGHRDALRGKTSKSNKDALLINGKKEWFRWVVRPWYNLNQEVGGILIYSENITEQVEAERKIRRQGAKFKSVFESSSIGWLECDVENTIQYIKKLRAQGVNYIDEARIAQDKYELWPHFKVLNYNSQISEIFGVRKDVQLTELKILSMMKEDAVQVFIQELEAMLDNQKSFETEFRITNLYGEERHLYLSVNYPEDDDYSHVLYSVLDITDLRQSVKALRQSEQRYKSMFKDNRLAVAYTNDEEDYFKVNPAFIKMFGYSQNELDHMKHEDIAVNKYVAESIENYRLLRLGNIRSFNMEKEYIHKEGHIVYANLSVTGLYDIKGQYFGNVAVIENISEKKEIYAKLNEQNKELKNINKELDRFVYSAAHDLRAPLANVKGLANLIKHTEISEEALNFVDLQLNSIDKLDTFIKSLVDYLKNSRHELQLEPIDFKQVIPDLIDQYRYGEKSRNIKFDYIVNQNKNFVSDHRRLVIVLSNLLSNAIRYSDSNKEQKEVLITVEVEETETLIRIKDNGIGIKEEDLQKIFKLFYRSSDNSEGTGIGLYLVKETVEKLEGSISVQSEFGEYTEFLIQLKSLA